MTEVRRRLHLLGIVLALSTLLLTGCEHDVYTITLTQRDGKLHRKVQMHLSSRGSQVESPQREEAQTQPAGRPGTSQPTSPKADSNANPRTQAEKFDRLTELYGQEPTLEDNRCSVAGDFGERLPDDLGGGTGRFYHYPTSLGSASCYVESFRGTHDAWGQLQLRLGGVDSAVDLLRATLREQLGDVEDFATLDDFLNSQFRHDAKSLAVYLWRFNSVQVGPGIAGPLDIRPFAKALRNVSTTRPTTNPAETQPASQPTTQPEEAEEIKATVLQDPLIQDGQKLQIARALLFLIEQGYISRQSLTGLADVTDDEQVWQILRDILIEQAQLPPQSPLLPALRTLLKDPETLQTLLLQQASRTDAWKQAARELDIPPNTNDEKQHDAIAKRWLQRTGIATTFNLHADLFGTNDELELSLCIQGKLIEEGTNGQVDPDKGMLTWNARLPDCHPKGQYANLPLVCYALWTRAEETFQNEHLGKVVFRSGDKDLMGYALWVNSLPKKKRKQWEEKLNRLTPETVGTIKEFTFAGEDEPAWKPHDAVRKLYNACNPDRLSGQEDEAESK